MNYPDQQTSVNGQSAEIVLHSAPWVVPISVPVLADGSVAVKMGEIVDIGARETLLKKYPGAKEIRYQSVLMPGLVNAHIHLELSHLKTPENHSAYHDFTDWISALIKKREEGNVVRSEIVAAFSRTLQDQHSLGVVAVCDIGNIYYEELDNDRLPDDWPLIYRMIEYLGPTRSAEDVVKKTIIGLENNIVVTAHAPYSTTPNLISFIKNRCNQLGHIFSIHVAESYGEIELIQKGSGIFRDFLEMRGSWDGSLDMEKEQFNGAIEYLSSIGGVDQSTLLVHCVHLTESEIELVKKKGAHVCICPGSNKFLGVGLPAVDSMVEVGILPALGTDSHASNEHIDLWQEMKIISENFPALKPDTVLAMATFAGARALNCSGKFGSLDVGRSAKFIHVESPGLLNCEESQEVVRELASGGRPQTISWLSTSADCFNEL